MTPERLGRLLGAPPVPEGSWEREAVLVFSVPLRRAADAGLPAVEVARQIAAQLRAEPGVADVRVRPNGFLVVLLSTPGEIVREILAEPPVPGTGPVPVSAFPDLPRTWDNPGFVIRFAYARAAAVRRWAAALGVPAEGFRPEALDAPRDRAVLRVLAELPSRTAGRDPGWDRYAERLALAYHDAHEQAPAVPMGDSPATEQHTSRVWLARAVQRVLSRLADTPLPDRM